MEKSEAPKRATGIGVDRHPASSLLKVEAFPNLLAEMGKTASVKGKVCCLLCLEDAEHMRILAGRSSKEER